MTKSCGSESSIYRSGEYAERNPSYHVEDSPRKATQILKMIRKHDLQIRSICEIGCGSGEILRQLQLELPEETEFYGYDVSPQAVVLSKQRENERLHCYCEDLLEKDTDPFDLLLCIDVFEHVEDYMNFLRKLREKAAHTIFHIPLDISVQAVLRAKPILLRRTQIGHIHYFTKDTALATLRDTGYEVIDWFYAPTRAMDRPTSSMARMAWIPRALLSLIHQDLAVRILGGYSLLVLAR